MPSGRPRIGFLGTGKMGAPMARRLLAAGYQLTVHDVRPEAMAGVCRDGAVAADSPAAVASRADLVITMLPDHRAVEGAVYGEKGLTHSMRAGQTLIEMTSSHPATTRRIAADLVARDIRLLDAPVSGGVPRAVDGTLCIMVGGPADVLEACRPVLAHLGRNIVHVGPAAGDGDAAKTINNMLSATAMWSVAEALALGARAGLDTGRLFEAVNHSSGRSYTTEVKIPMILQRRFDAAFTIAQYLKDLNICLDLAGELGVPMLLASMLRQAWTAAAAQDGMAASDNTELVRLIDRWAGLAESR
jgi:3-hydroxyisobutyrate dehydrogenase-like beta-hydroxyacid dehydrogenase